jgi:hypothetical protein
MAAMGAWCLVAWLWALALALAVPLNSYGASSQPRATLLLRPRTMMLVEKSIANCGNEK